LLAELWLAIPRKRFSVPTVASASVQPHSHAPEARGRAHSGREPAPSPAHPFAELLEGTCDFDCSPPAQANNSGPQDPPAQAAAATDAKESKECKPTKEEKCAAKDAKKIEKSERKEAREAEKTNCARSDVDCAEIEATDLAGADECAGDIEDIPVVEETTTDESIVIDEPVAPAASLAPAPPPPTSLTPEAAVRPPAIMPPDLLAAIDNAEPVEAMPPVQPLGAASPKSPIDAAAIPPATTFDPAEQAAGLAEQIPVAPNRPNVQDNLASEIEVERQPPRRPERAPALNAANSEAERSDDSAEQNQDPPAEKTPEQRDLPPHAVAAQNIKQDKTPERNGHKPGEPGLQLTELAEARPQEAPSHPTGQIYASSVANPHALEAPAAVRGVAHGIPAPAVLVPIAGLAIEIAARLQAGRNRFEIRLDPPELGRVDVRLDVDREGNVSSRLVVERAETLELLRRDASQLERALQQAGLKTADNSLQFSLRDQSSARHDDDNPNRARVIVPDPDLIPADTGRIYGRMLGLGGGVDIRV
jgi:flagellar hook-length control protein FliK